MIQDVIGYWLLVIAIFLPYIVGHCGFLQEIVGYCNSTVCFCDLVQNIVGYLALIQYVVGYFDVSLFYRAQTQSSFLFHLFIYSGLSKETTTCLLHHILDEALKLPIDMCLILSASYRINSFP